MELNNTRKAKKDILFFNRVPKVGLQDILCTSKWTSIGIGKRPYFPLVQCTVYNVHPYLTYPKIYISAGGKPNDNGAVKIAVNKEQVPLPQGPNAEG